MMPVILYLLISKKAVNAYLIKNSKGGGGGGGGGGGELSQAKTSC